MDRKQVSNSRKQLLTELARIQRDEEPFARAVGSALTGSARDALDPEERQWVARIETLREEMEASTEEIDIALANQRGSVRPAPMSDICHLRSKKRPWGMFLLSLAHTLRPERAIELGTCLGISAAYLAAGLDLAGDGHLMTLEGAPALAERSRNNLAALGLDNVEVRTGRFAETLGSVLEQGGPVGLAVIDGHHEEEATLAYFDQISGHLTEPAVVVFDDIHWSDGMTRAWSTILDDSRVRVAVDLSSVGVCVVSASSNDPVRIYRLPTITAMQRAFAPA